MKVMRFWMIAATMAATFTACVDNSDNPVGKEVVVTPEAYTEPTTDQLGVRVMDDLPVAVLGQFDDNSTGAALVRRFTTTSGDIDYGTQFVLLKGSDFENGSPLSDEQMYLTAVTYMSGGYIAIERPTEKQLDNFYDAFIDAAYEVMADLLEEDFDMEEDEALAAARQSSLGERMNARKTNVNSYARRAGVDTESEVVAEMLIYGPIDYFYQEPFNSEKSFGIKTQDGEGPVSEPVKQTVTFDRNAYRSGLMADAAVAWLNDSEERLFETEDLDPVNSARRRAGASDAINSMMSASETFTFSGQMYWRDENNKYGWSDGRVQQTIRTWGVHSFSNNKDYYYVQQNISLNMGDQGQDGNWMIGKYRDGRYWTFASGYGKWDRYYGSFLSEYTTSMDLTGKGTILLEAATPETDNASTTTSVNIGTSSSHTETAGISFSGTFGLNGGKPTATVTAGANFSAGATSGNSFALNSSRAYKDLRPVKNRSFNKVTWTYKGNLPKFRMEYMEGSYWYFHETAADILVNTANLTNEICWSVANPEGRYTLNVTSYPETAALLYQYDGGSDQGSHYEYTNCWVNNQFSHELLQPNRYQQKWNMSVTVDETSGTTIPGLGAALEKRIAEQYPELFQKEFTVADKSPESLEMASAFINYAKGIFGEQYDILQNMAKDQGVKKFTINWRRQGSKTKEAFTVIADLTNNLVADGGTEGPTNKIGNLFDADFSTKWMAESEHKEKGKLWFVEFHAPKSVSPKSYTMVTATDAAQNYLFNPCVWYLYGKKKTADQWTLLATVDDSKNNGNGLPWANSSSVTKSFDVKPAGMQYFRLEADSWSYAIQLAEFYFNY